jgi:hypothetical protein
MRFASIALLGLCLGAVACGGTDAPPIGAPALDGGDASTLDADACGCIDDPIEWGMDGGLVPVARRNTLSRCRRFAHFVEDTFEGGRRVVCEHDLADCSGPTSTFGDVVRALAHPDVEAAIALGHVVYGEDGRPLDRPIFDFRYRSGSVGVGTPCPLSLAAPCQPIPAGIDALKASLEKLAAQELARAACLEPFPIGEF